MSRVKSTVAAILLACLAAQGSALADEASAPQLMLDTGGHMAKVAGVLITPDGRQLVSASNDKTIRIWDTATGKALRMIGAHIDVSALRRAETELALGDRFDRQRFNDFLLDQGLLPPDLLAKAVREEFVPRQKAKTPGR